VAAQEVGSGVRTPVLTTSYSICGIRKNSVRFIGEEREDVITGSPVTVRFVRCTYTVNHKKRATLFLIITLAFLGRFLYFLYQWKQEGILYKQINKIYHFILTVSPHYLVKLKTTYKQHMSQSSQYVRSNRLFATFVESFATFAESCPMFVFSNSW